MSDDDYDALEQLFNEQRADRRRRRSRELRFDERYREHESIRASADCFYCGASGRSRDHYPPLSQASEHPACGEWWLVRSCGRCNSVLGTTMQATLAERKQWVQARIREIAEAKRLKSMSDDLKMKVKGQATYGKR